MMDVLGVLRERRRQTRALSAWRSKFGLLAGPATVLRSRCLSRSTLRSGWLRTQQAARQHAGS